ncbi:hypothetical protein TWF569_006454 [Orbilia oligospora]|uniref:Uncharacterized protein n=1 Tax=Orbilia oligospora TaxID=2813651 RepID=A0A7C8J2R9_ORBOL|nr:hypothetical protein TWF102_004630 [Orbilia oligospora]KAF3092088.1 hypothetical protein TWF103_011387 [Orbilia oligospora]KAF3145904.1 hypothetical protein TWF569_006454 [Orbilia oligospora]
MYKTSKIFPNLSASKTTSPFFPRIFIKIHCRVKTSTMSNLVVLGGGESGVGTAILGQKQGYTVFLSDSSKIKDTYKQTLTHHNILFEDGGHTESKILSADIVMKSPGIPDTAPIIQKLLQKTIPVISEIEFTSTHSTSQTIGITGSNGKTTTTMLTHHLLENGGLNVGIGGNIGKSYALQVAESSYSSYVLELSSFQLDGIVKYAPHIAVITNISPDHLDRYEYKYEKYIDAKFRITMNQTEEDYLIYDADDEATANWLSSNTTKARLIPFSIKRTIENGACLSKDGKSIVINIDEQDLIIDTENISLQGKHNYKNSMAAVIIAKILKIDESSIRSSLKTFRGAEHRLERVLNVRGVEYIDDSKATNVNSVFYALDAMKTPTVWIVGGVDKGNDYSEITELVKEKVKAIVCLGVDNRKIIGFFGGVVDKIAEARSMIDAVNTAQGFAGSGETVLLSPACASFDLFKSYEDRGRQFKDAVRGLRE